MLRQRFYSILDTKAEAYSPPFLAMNDAVASRMFSNSVNQEETTQLFHHPEDFVLFCIGEFDALEGKLSGLDAPLAVARGIDLKRKEV